MDDRFVYTPLKKNQMRLLELERGRWHSKLSAQLIHVDLDDLPPYKAISYAWGGSQMRPIKIQLNGRQFKTTTKTFEALWTARIRSLLDDHELSRVWIDAICINQKDRVERGQQVAIMGSIYAKADQVIVCMSPADFRLRRKKYQDANIRAQFGAQLMNDIQSAYEPIEKIPLYPNPPPSFFANSPVPLKGIRKRLVGLPGQGLADLLSNQWHGRVWVLQEVGLASRVKVYYFKLIIPWEMVVFTSAFLKAQGPTIRNSIKMYPSRIDLMTRDFWHEGSALDFLEVLIRARKSKATDPRDKVFALLSHPSARQYRPPDTIVQPDYTKTSKEVAFEIATKLILGPEPLKLLSAVQHPVPGSEKLKAFPTWVPRWDSHDYMTQTILGLDSRYRAGGATPLEMQLHGRTLTIRGLLFDEIHYQSDTMRMRHFLLPTSTTFSRLKSLPKTIPNLFHNDEDSDDPDDYHNTFSVNPVASIWDDISELAGLSRKASSTLYFWEAYQRTLTADNYLWFSRGRSSPLVWSGDLEASLRCLQRRVHERGVHGIFVRGQDAKKVATKKFKSEEKASLFFLEQAASVCQSRCFFVTRRGCFGLGPAASPEGDAIFIPFGSTVPFVLRQFRKRWKLVGECYVDGIMNGEGIDMWESGEDIEERTCEII